MSVVAFDGKVLAADRGSVAGRVTLRGQKIYALPGGLIAAFVGGVAAQMAMLEWVRCGMQPSAWPEIQGTEDWARMILAQDGKLVTFEQSPYPAPVVDKFTAWGSGSDIAIGAMAAGASAMRAVQIACKHHSECAHGAEGFQVRGRK